MGRPTAKRKDEPKADPVRRKKTRMTIRPRMEEDIPASDASTLPMDVTSMLISDIDEVVHVDSDLEETGASDISAFIQQEGGGVATDLDSDTDLSDEELGFKETDPLREDIPINRDRWEDEEVGALMDGININRDALKFHFDGAGGGKDVKRKGWLDVANHVNDTAETHRTIKQCRNKVSDFTQNAKQKYNKLRYQVNQTGRGRVSKKLHLSKNQEKALDYLRQEAIKGIPDIEELDIPCVTKNVPSVENLALLWEPERETKPQYSKIKMERSGVPKNYKEKNKRRSAKELKIKRQKANERKQKRERKEEQTKQRKQEREERQQLRQDRRERKAERKRIRAERKRRNKDKKVG